MSGLVHEVNREWKIGDLGLNSREIFSTEDRIFIEFEIFVEI